MAILTNSSITASSAPSGWFAVTTTSFIVDVEAGEVLVESRRDSSDTVPKLLTKADGFSPQTITGPRTMVVDNPVSGREYRLRPVTTGSAGLATASANA